MRESPRLRRLRNDFAAMERLKAESTILDFLTPGAMHGGPPEVYEVYFHGAGLAKPADTNLVSRVARHHVTIQLGASYPRMIPEMKWRSPIFHPNISAAGVVCLGGYSTHWVPSLQLDELCSMLWDMIRYANFDVDSPYNREAAQWVRTQADCTLPLDHRPIRDKLVDERSPHGSGGESVAAFSPQAAATASSAATPLVEAEILFMDGEVVEAEIVSSEGDRGGLSDIIYIE